ncbi:HNH endonuclease [Nesterenkonia suensis]
MPTHKPGQTPRTATTQWKATRRKVIRRAQRDHITQCPECGITLDYHNHGRRNSVQVDHILPVAQGGTDRLTNLRVCCARCNASLGAKQKPKKMNTKQFPDWSDDANNW